MRFLQISLIVLFVSACGPLTANDKTILEAEQYIGLQERQDRRVLRDLVGVDPVRTEWCAAFVNAILEAQNIPGSSSVSENPLMARSFLSWGQRVDPAEIQPGDIVIFPRGTEGWKGHVGFFVEEQNSQWVILGGNQSNQVRYDLYNPRKALGVRSYIAEE